MSISIVLLKKLSEMFLFMMTGYILYKIKVITPKRNSYMESVLLYIVYPSVVLYSFDVRRNPVNLQGFTMSFIFAVISLAISMIISYARYTKRYGIENVATAYSSAASMGIPIVSFLFGHEAVFYASCFGTILTFLQWTYGVMIITGDREYISLKKVVLNPIFVSFVAGFLLYFFYIDIPVPAKRVFEVSSFINAPLVMLILGVYLAQADIKNMFRDKNAYTVCLYRLLIIPVITLMIIKFIPTDNKIKMITMLVASAPVGSNVAVFAKVYRSDYIKAVKLVCLSTLLSIITMPLIARISEIILYSF